MSVTVYSNDTSNDWTATGAELIIQNVKNILRTRQFEVPFMRDFGINQDFIDATTPRIKSDFLAHVRDVISANESRVNIIDVRIESCDADSEYVIVVELEVLE